ncbi:MAG TPA: S9 family peptidase [Chloroflexia bacterium]|nr:S9 family peptidase [Chloroflexia bacterium]
MSEPQVAPYGSWKSPITSDLIVAKNIGLGAPSFDGENIYWSEGRPQEGGRTAIVRRAPDGTTSDVLPLPFNARTRVHEYGGGSYLIADGILYFSNFADQRLYRLKIGESQPEALTPEVDLRYADGVIDRQRNSLIMVREDHTGEGEAINTIVRVGLEGENPGTVLVSGYDFFSSPRLSPNGVYLAWLAWNHPNMPWDGTELWVGQLDKDGSIVSSERVAGGLRESIFQPEWSPDGTLYFASDRTNWWNLYRWKDGKTEALHPLEAEFGEPQWVFGLSMYAFSGPNRIVCSFYENGFTQLGLLNTDSGKLERVESPYTEFGGMHASATTALFNAYSPVSPSEIVKFDLESRSFEVLRRSSDLEIEPGYISEPQAIEFPTENGLTAHAFFYPPKNQDFIAPAGEKPPLLVKSHGGPTSFAPGIYNLQIQYWTSRGIGVLDVNYGGSTGYGREYRERLKGQWGIVDVDDCVNGARYLAEKGLVDGNRLAIDGGSAGGYTTLCALTFRDAFKAGASHFGVSDAEALAQDTHKFESRYLDGLIGPYPQARDLYVQRSPIHFTERLNCPLILFQGLEDKVVPPSQAEKMFAAVKAKGLPVAYLPFEGEQHGFRRSENIKRSLDAELYFYSKIFGFDLADNIEPVQIENLKA